MNTKQPYSSHFGLLRLNIEDNWSALAFGYWLLEIQRIYYRLSFFLIFSETYSEEIDEPEHLFNPKNLKLINRIMEELNNPLLVQEKDFALLREETDTTVDLEESLVERLYQEFIEQLNQAPSLVVPIEQLPFLIHPLLEAQEHTTDLDIFRIQISSPGFVELIGNLNPLKIIADFITAWRHENTIRSRDALQFQLEQTRIKAEALKMLLEKVDNLKTKSSLDFVRTFVDHTFEQPQKALAVIAKDKRIKDVSLKQWR